MKIDSAAVKVMRSYDYCHFEVSLSTDNKEVLTSYLSPEDVDELRKQAARLVDKAVEQYIIAKKNRERLAYGPSMGQQEEFAEAIATPEPDRTPEDKALVKAASDAAFHANRQYDYEDDWERDEDSGY